MNSKRKNVSKQSFFLRVALLIFSIYAIYSLIQLQAVLIAGKSELSNLVNEAKEQEIKNKELEALLNDGNENTLIERAARDKLGYVYSDEQVFEIYNFD